MSAASYKWHNKDDAPISLLNLLYHPSSHLETKSRGLRLCLAFKQKGQRHTDNYGKSQLLAIRLHRLLEDPFDQFQSLLDLYKAIREDVHTSEDRKVTIFVSALEVDSVCALRILQGILKIDGVHYSIYPVTGYSEVASIVGKQLNDEEIRNVVLINFGACEDIAQMLNCREGTRLIIIDSRRPIHHNFTGEMDERAVLICDPDDIHPGGEGAMPEPDGRSDAEASDLDDEDDKENIPDSKRRRSESAQGLQDEGREQLSRKELRKKRRQAVRRRRKDYYEIGAFWGRPAALTMLRLAQELQQSDKHTLWLGAVALTDQLVHQRIAPEKYAAYAMTLETEMKSEGGPEDEPEIAIRVETADGEIRTTKAKNPITRVTAEKDLRFALMRHWSLYDAMMHSTHVAVRMQTWADKGRRKLEELLAKMGFRIKECKLDFSEMRMLIHQQLEKKLEEYGHTAQLNEIVFQSFHLHWGYRTPLSATDAVYGISALMESHNTRPYDNLEGADTFWRAWEALNPGNTEDMRHGLELAKQLQRAILTDGGLIISRKDVRSNSTHFCWVDLTKSAVTNKTLLSQPMALVKLGVFLRDQRVWRTPQKRRQAVILFGPATSDRSCLIVSVSSQPSVGNIEKAAAAAKCDIAYDGFDTCVGKVSVDSIERLVNELAIAASEFV